MSDEFPERNEMLRSTIITIFLTVVFLIIGLALWAWSSPDIIETSPIGALNNFNPFVTVLIEALSMLCVFIFFSVTVINLRLFISQVRAGWFEIVTTFIIVTAISWLMFGSAVGGVTAIFSLGFIVYLYLLQE
ncbi:hypothetical protein EU527_07185 [Candidatus Thorarchaeota archaeon]|nr:MAG: hypothetical protein EU527_07185 [Candidatus Thorarchaeota archaeon]